MHMQLEKWKRSPEVLAAVSAFAVGVFSHCFALVNPIHNYDNILQHPQGVGAGVTSGRWMLDLLGDFNTQFLDMNYNLPFPKGLALILLIAVSAGFLVNVLKIQNRVSAGLLGCLLVTFPTVCSTMVFRYTAEYYGLALLLSVLAVWVVDRSKFGIIWSAVCLACSMGIYQAYAPFTIGLFLLLLIRQSLQPDARLSSLIARGFYYCGAIILGVAMYFVMVKVGLALYSTNEEVVLDTYLGINNMGKISLDRLPRLIKRAFSYGALFAVRNYCGLAPHAVLKLAWCLLILGIVAIIGVIVVKKKIGILNVLFCGMMGLLFPLGINFQMIMSPDFMPYTIMVYSIVLVGCAPLMLLECLPENLGLGRCSWRQIVAALLLLISLYNAYYTNYNYTALHYANRQVENYLNSLTTQVRMTEGFTAEKKWVLIGDIHDPMLWNQWNEDLYFGGFINCSAKGLLRATYSLHAWFNTYLGIGVPFASESETRQMMENAQVDQMECWPNAGSVQIIDDYVVIKFQQIDEIKP